MTISAREKRFLIVAYYKWRSTCKTHSRLTEYVFGKHFSVSPIEQQEAVMHTRLQVSLGDAARCPAGFQWQWLLRAAQRHIDWCSCDNTITNQ